MSGHRIELHVTYTVDDGTDGGRHAAETVARALQSFADSGILDDYTSSIEVTPCTVDGNGWWERWLERDA